MISQPASEPIEEHHVFVICFEHENGGDTPKRKPTFNIHHTNCDIFFYSIWLVVIAFSWISFFVVRHEFGYGPVVYEWTICSRTWRAYYGLLNWIYTLIKKRVINCCGVALVMTISVYVWMPTELYVASRKSHVKTADKRKRKKKISAKRRNFSILCECILLSHLSAFVKWLRLCTNEYFSHITPGKPQATCIHFNRLGFYSIFSTFLFSFITTDYIIPRKLFTN